MDQPLKKNLSGPTTKKTLFLCVSSLNESVELKRKFTLTQKHVYLKSIPFIIIYSIQGFKLETFIIVTFIYFYTFSYIIHTFSAFLQISIIKKERCK